MENQDVKNVQSADETAEMKHYEELVRWMRFILLPPATQEAPDMKTLQRKLKRFVAIMDALSNRDWSEGIAEIQEAWGVYLLANKIDEKRVKRMNETISTHLQFLVYMAENRDTLKHLLAVLNRHYIHVTKVMNRMKGAPCKP